MAAETLETKAQTNDETLSFLPPSLRQDETVRNYFLEKRQAEQVKLIYKKAGQHIITNPNGTPEEILSYGLVSCLKQYGIRDSHIKYISKFLTKDELEVAMKTPLITPTEYVYVARVKNMEPGELLGYSINYEPKEEHRKEIHTITREWTQMERNLLAWNLGVKYKRPPTQKEIEDALCEEILKKGGSHSKKCRAFTVLAHKEWFIRKQQPNP